MHKKRLKPLEISRFIKKKLKIHLKFASPKTKNDNAGENKNKYMFILTP